MLSTILASTLNIALYRSAVAYRPPTLLLTVCVEREKKGRRKYREKEKKIEYDM
jgi:hypothetical protein